MAAPTVLSVSLATTLVAGLFSFAQWWVQTDVEARRSRFEIAKYYFANPATFDPCKAEFLTALAILARAYPEMVESLQAHGLQGRAERCANPEQRKESLSAIGATLPAKAAPPGNSTNPSTIRIYVHFPENDAAKQAAAQQVQARLREAGYTVLGIEGVRASPSQNEIRIYRGSPDQKEAASQVASRIPPERGPFKVVDISGAFPNLPPNVFEIWLAR
jgi:hypothetical protein